jgi:ABC-2 type transport system permease protein
MRGEWLSNSFKYAWIGYTAARSELAYRAANVSRVLFLATVLYVFMQLWSAVYAGVGTEELGGLTQTQMLWYLVATEAILMSMPRLWYEVDQDVRTGSLAVQLVRPLSYAATHFGRSMGERVVRFTFNLVVGSVLAMLLAGPIAFSVSGVGMFLLVLPMAFILDFLGALLVGLCAFWLESTQGIALIYSRLMMLLGGLMVPLDVYPDSVQPILRALPFAAILHAPGKMLVAPSTELFLQCLALQAACLVVYGAGAYALHTLALRRLFVNGG